MPVSERVVARVVPERVLSAIELVKREIYYKYIGRDVRVVLWVGVNTRAGFRCWESVLRGVTASSTWATVRYGGRIGRRDLRRLIARRLSSTTSDSF